jgi:hypothetical protein
MEEKKLIAWQAQFDYLYEVIVYRTEPYKGRLVVKNIRTEEVLLDEETNISFDARFGADYEDVQIWQQKAISVVDNLPESKCPF